jgi:hypothetical protein
MDYAEAGWSKFKEREAPSFVMVKVLELVGGTPYPALIEGYDKAFRVRVKLADQFAKGRASVREFSSSSFIVLRAFDSLFDQWFGERASNPGKLPLVAVDSYEEIDGKFGTNMAPVFRIKAWVDRPRDLPDSAMTTPAPANPPVAQEAVPNRARKPLDDLDDEIPF